MTTIHTIGHSTRGADEFRAMLEAYGVKLLVDVRQFPGSRRCPHFSAKALAESLVAVGIDYQHEVDLGGRRRPQADSPNAFWRNTSFRAFADHMASAPFQAALARLIEHGERCTTAIMCAEAVPWRCHRWLISDVLVSRGLEAVHILDAAHSEHHALNPAAQRDEKGMLIYPAVHAT